VNGSLPSLKDTVKEKVGDQAGQVKEGLEDSGGPIGLATKAADKLGSKAGGGDSR